MSKKTKYILGILLTIFIGTLLYWKFCCNCCQNSCTKDNIIQSSTNNFTDINNQFRIVDSDLNYQCADNFNFRGNGFEMLQPISDSINNGIAVLKSYLDNNNTKQFTITGYCTSDEKNNSAFPTLGHARANNIKNYFISKGIPSDRIEINGEVRENWNWQNDTIVGSATFQLNTAISTATDEEDLEALKNKINANPLILYFNTNQTEISFTPEEQQKVADITRYLDKVATAKISAIGHTDNVGDRAMNIQLGKERADFAKAYLVKNGINADKIISSSKGPDEPIADNNTADGKAKNRRTVVTIQ
jgi:OOP family OmpA-OmpF porin